MQPNNPKLIAILIAIVGFVVLPIAKSVSAQEQPNDETKVSDDQLRAFAKVYVQIDKIRQEYEPRLKAAKDPEEGQQIQTEAVAKMNQAAAKEGITAETYRQIFDLTNADEGVRNRVLSLIDEEKKKS